jgi:hypothetical protein
MLKNKTLNNLLIQVAYIIVSIFIAYIVIIGVLFILAKFLQSPSKDNSEEERRKIIKTNKTIFIITSLLVSSFYIYYLIKRKLYISVILYLVILYVLIDSFMNFPI